MKNLGNGFYEIPKAVLTKAKLDFSTSRLIDDLGRLWIDVLINRTDLEAALDDFTPEHGMGRGGVRIAGRLAQEQPDDLRERAANVVANDRERDSTKSTG